MNTKQLARIYKIKKGSRVKIYQWRDNTYFYATALKKASFEYETFFLDYLKDGQKHYAIFNLHWEDGE